MKDASAEARPRPALRDEAEKNALLASVSRSFYLTIRALPKTLREPIRTAYLLARATDTIADTPAIGTLERLAGLRALSTWIQEKEEPDEKLAAIISMAERQPAQAEKNLLTQLPELLADYRALSEEDVAAEQILLEKIVRGQEQDLLTFPDAEHVRALPTAAALEEYTYLVAGCVGEFWTTLCARKLVRFAERPYVEMMVDGRAFGQGLQLVNILRDLRADVAMGRCYLPINPANMWEDPDAERAFGQWMIRARDLLGGGWRYVLAVRSWRLRFACALPVLIGYRTLRLLETHSPFRTTERVKISRTEVASIIWQTAGRVYSKRLLDRFRRRVCMTD